MASVFSLLLNMDITASLIICVVLLARLCMRRLPKIYSYVLWSVVLFRLLCPVSLSLPISILAPFSEASSQSSAATSTMEYISVQPRLFAAAGDDNVPVSAPLANETFTEQDAVIESAYVPSGDRIDTEPETKEASMSAREIILTICGWIWVLGIIAISVVTIWQHIKLKKHLATAWILRGNVYESEEIDTAFVMGVFSPKIYLPNGLPFDVQKAVLLHEQTHQARGDNIVKVIAYIALALHWFNPLVWLAYKLACDDMEKSCDEAVIRGMTKRGYEMKSVKYAYGKMLVALGSGQWYFFSPVSFAESHTKERVKNIIAYKKVALRNIISICCLCSIIIGFGLINPRKVNNGTTYYSAIGNVEESEAKGILIKIGSQEYWSNSVELSIDLSSSEDANNLSDLQYFENLRSLSLSESATRSTESVDISFLANLEKLEVLRINGLSIKDYAPISTCSRLKQLEITNYKPDSYYILRNNNIVFGLQGLESLTVDFIDINCIDELANLKSLKKIAIYGGFVSGTEKRKLDDVGALSETGLRKLYEAFPNLEGLSIPILSAREAGIISEFNKLNWLTVYDTVYDLKFPENFYNLNLFSALSGLTSLKCLNIETNHYYDFSFIRSMKGLKELYITQSDESFVSKDVSDNIRSQYLQNYDNIAWCTGLNRLEISLALSLDGYYGEIPTEMQPVSFINNLSELEIISLGCINVDLSALSCTQSLKELTVGSANIDGVKSIGEFHSLEKVHIHDCFYNKSPILVGDEFTSAGNLSRLKSISINAEYNTLMPPEELSLDDYSVPTIDLMFTSTITSLESVDIAIPQIRNVSALQNSPGLIYLRLGNIEMNEDFSFLSNMHKIKELDIQCVGGLKDVSFLSDMTSLSTLNISGDFADLPSLKKLNNLKYVTIRSPKLVSITGIKGNSSINTLNFLGCNELRDASPIGSVASLEKLHLDIVSIGDISFLLTNDSLTNLTLCDIENLNAGDCDIAYYCDDVFYGIYGTRSISSDSEQHNNIKTDFTVLQNVIKQLTFFCYDGSYMTREEVKALEQTNPQCRIEARLPDNSIY